MQPIILIADRNPNVRKYMEREMAGSGYEVSLAESSSQLLYRLRRQPPANLVIVDPDFPDVEVWGLLKNIREIQADIPVVVHSHGGEGQETNATGIWFVEKRANSIEWIKRIVAQILFRPGRKSPQL